MPGIFLKKNTEFKEIFFLNRKLEVNFIEVKDLASYKLDTRKRFKNGSILKFYREHYQVGIVLTHFNGPIFGTVLVHEEGLIWM